MVDRIIRGVTPSVGTTIQESIVSSASYEAREFGVRSG
jgi:nucleotidyltransferase/DNA polymerase involved in DNA repair